MLLQIWYFGALSWWDKPVLQLVSHSLCLSYFLLICLISFKFTLWQSIPSLSFSLFVYILPPAESAWTEDDTNKKGLLSALFDNLSLRDSLIIHASLTGYLLSFCISLLKGMRKVEGYVAIINFPVTQQWHLSNWAEYNLIKQTFGFQSGSWYFKEEPVRPRCNLFITKQW